MLFIENNLRYVLFDVYTELYSYIKYKNLNEKVFTNVQNLRLYYKNLTINKNFVQLFWFLILYKNTNVFHMKIIAPYQPQCSLDCHHQEVTRSPRFCVTLWDPTRLADIHQNPLLSLVPTPGHTQHHLVTHINYSVPEINGLKESNKNVFFLIWRISVWEMWWNCN